MKLSQLLDAFYPPACAGCRTPGTPFCEACAPQSSERMRFERAGLPVVAVGAYAGPLRRAILALKRGRRDVARPLAALIAAAVASERLARKTVLVPVPTSRGNVAVRGFDQGIALARELAAIEDRPVLVALQKRVSIHQRGRNRAQRLQSAGRFAATQPVLVTDCDVVLVDDVVTTGGTLADCAATLAASGACVRGAFVLARA